MTFFAIPVRDQVQFEPRVLELQGSNYGFEVSFPGDFADSMFAVEAERTNSFGSSWEAEYAAELAKAWLASILEKLGGR